VAKYSFYFGSYPGRGKVERISGSEDRRTDVKKTNFYCLRCGTCDIVKKDNIKFFAECENFHPRSKSASLNDVETTFFVTASLYCVRCKHTYFLKILDEGTK
jgi:hypothetical protein